MRYLVLIMLLCGLGLGAGVVAAQDGFSPTPAPVSDDEVNRVAKQMYCPVCENIPLDVCPTEACRQWRQTIREKLALGWDERQVKEYFVTQYGERVLAEPTARGLTVLVWVLPPLAVAVGGFFLWRFLRANTRAAAPAVAAPAEEAPKDDYQARLEAELRERR
jgi:cytochrome c-type biogenesis protein CcmH